MLLTWPLLHIRTRGQWGCEVGVTSGGEADRVCSCVCVCVYVYACVCMCMCACRGSLPLLLSGSSVALPCSRRSVCVCVRACVQPVCLCVCVQLGPASLSLSLAPSLPPSALNGLDSRPRKKHRGTTGERMSCWTEDRPGKVGRPSFSFPLYLPAPFSKQRTQKTRHLSSSSSPSAGLRERERACASTPAHKELQQLFASRTGWGFLLMTTAVHGSDPGEQGPCTDLVLVSRGS